MKKILTLLIAAGAFVSLHAQSREETRRIILGDRTDNGTYDNRNERDVVLGRNDRNNGSYSSNRGSRIDQVNRTYDNKVSSIRNNPHLSNAEKKQMIRRLEQDRQRRIRELNRNGNDRYNDRDDRYARNGNGKKRGWEIGRGNPHRNADDDKRWKKNKNKGWDD